MAGPTVRPDSFLRWYRSQTRQLASRPSALSEELTPEGVHDLRVNVRRLQASLKLVPKDLRDSRSSRSFERGLRSLLDGTSTLRDADTLLKIMEPYRTLLPQKLLITMAKSRRNAEAAASAAIKSFNLPAPPLSLSTLDSKRLTRRLRRRISKRSKDTSSLLRKVIRDEAKVKALHSLRLRVKKLRYLFEIADGKPEALNVLPVWQDILGSIHDLDMAVAYVERNARPPATEVLGELRRARHMEYERFISQSKAGSQRALKLSR
jgi:CHAD domain-containing protein